MNIFEVAVKEKYRFNYRGVITVEDLWDLSVKSLDVIFKDLNSQAKKTNEESLLSVRDNKDTELENKIEIVKYIVKEKLEEQTAKTIEKEKREQKQKIMEILATKQEQSLQNKSEEELLKMLEEL